MHGALAQPPVTAARLKPPSAAAGPAREGESGRDRGYRGGHSRHGMVRHEQLRAAAVRPVVELPVCAMVLAPGLIHRLPEVVRPVGLGLPGLLRAVAGVRAGYPPARPGNNATKSVEDRGDLLTMAEAAGLGRDPSPGRGGRAPLAAAFPLPVFRGGTAPDAVDLVVAECELQALTPDCASGADLLGPRYLPFRGAGRGDREEEIRVRGPAGTCRPPVCSTPSRIHRVSSHGI